MTTEIRIVIADDHPIFRQGLRQVIEKEKGLQVVGEAADGEAALEQITLTQPDVAVLDVDMPVLDGFDVVRALHERRWPGGIVCLTMHTDEDIFNEALDLGIKGYVLKDSAVTDIVGAIRAVNAGQNYLSPQLSNFLLNRGARASALLAERPSLKDLTPTERRVLKLIADNKTNREIAAALFLSVRTVENHRAHMCQKLDLHGSHTLLAFALENKSQLA